MKSLMTVAKFTMREMVRKKSFVISTLIILVLIVIGFSIPKLIKTFLEDKPKDRLEIVDKDNVFEGNLETLKQMDLEKYEISIENISFEDIKSKIENQEIDSAIMIEKSGEQVKIRYIVEDISWVREVPEDLLNSMKTIYANMQISKLGINVERLKSINPDFETSLEQTKEGENMNEGNIFMMMAVCFALSISIIFFTAQVSTSITTEKTSKIVETLVTSTSPKTIVLGKTIGVGLIGLIQLILIVGTAIISAKIFLDEEMINAVLDVSNITPYFGIITIIYFILGYFMYALLYAVTGSMVSKPEDIQSANTPVSLVAMIGFYLGYFSIAIDPTSSVSAFSAIFPLSSPFSMAPRVMMGLANGWDVAISIAILAVVVFVIAKIAIKIYSNAILNYGAKKGLKDIFKIYKEED